jgi:hypothetical protein
MCLSPSRVLRRFQCQQDFERHSARSLSSAEVPTPESATVAQFRMVVNARCGGACRRPATPTLAPLPERARRGGRAVVNGDQCNAIGGLGPGH